MIEGGQTSMKAGMDELALLRGWQAGDRAAGDRLLRRYAASVFRFFRAKTDAATAEELVQVTFEVCTRHRDEIDPRCSVRGYLIGIARHRWLQHVDRSLGRRARFEPLERSVVADQRSQSGAVARDEHGRIVIAAVRGLGPEFRSVVELHYWRELSVDEVARALGVRPGTVKSRLHRARDALRSRLAELVDDPVVARVSTRDLEHWIGSVRATLPG